MFSRYTNNTQVQTHPHSLTHYICIYSLDHLPPPLHPLHILPPSPQRHGYSFTKFQIPLHYNCLISTSFIHHHHYLPTFSPVPNVADNRGKTIYVSVLHYIPGAVATTTTTTTTSVTRPTVTLSVPSGSPTIAPIVSNSNGGIKSFGRSYNSILHEYSVCEFITIDYDNLIIRVLT